MSTLRHVLPLLRWLPAIIITAISWHLSSQSRIEEMPDFWNADKLVHLVCYGGLAFWVAFGCGASMRTTQRQWLTVALVSAYGIVDELHQSLVPGRTASVADWLADTLGAILGAVVFAIVAKWWHSRRR